MSFKFEKGEVVYVEYKESCLSHYCYTERIVDRHLKTKIVFTDGSERSHKSFSSVYKKTDKNKEILEKRLFQYRRRLITYKIESAFSGKIDWELVLEIAKKELEELKK
ncbi:MAG: hypothetical protein ACRCX2_11390 [Paraclostridium sp.]